MSAEQFETLMQAIKEVSKEMTELKLLMEEQIAWREYAEKRFDRLERRLSK